MGAYETIALNDLFVFITDLDVARPKTRNAYQIIKDLNREIPGGIGRRKVYFRDAQGRYNRLSTKNRQFKGFNALSPSQQNLLDKIADGQIHPMGPSSVEEAIDLLNTVLTADEKREIAETPKENLIEYHFSLGRWIRNNFDLWAENSALLEALGSTHPDHASKVLIERYWRSLQK